MKSFLKKVKIFSSLSEEELEVISQNIRKDSFRKNTTIFSQGDPGNSFYIVAEGAVKVSQLAESGKEITLAILYQNESFGEMALFEGKERSATVTAIRECKVFILTRAALFSAIHTMPDIAIKLLAVLSEKLAQTNGQIEVLAFDTLRQRLARLILSFWEKDSPDTGCGQDYIFPFTQKETADILGATRESITRLFNDFKKEGLVNITQRTITIPNIHAFEDIIYN